MRAILFLLVPLSMVALSCGSDEGDGPSTGGTGGSGAGGSGGTSSTASGSGGTNEGAGGSTSAAGSAAGGSSSAPPPLDDFTGDCSTAQWGAVGEACWACMCNACTDTLNACNGDCVGAFDCSTQNDCWVEDLGTELLCEIRCQGNTCFQGPNAGEIAGPLANLDGCLIGSSSASQARACEAECGITYPGDVCARFPQ